MEDSPSIAEKLARSARLEADFQRALETEKLEAIAEFAAGAGHEINNPLTVISGRAQLLLRDEADPERRRALALISVQAMRVYEMIADMMLFARPPLPELQKVDLSELIDSLAADLSPRCAAQETVLRRIGESQPAFIEADPIQMNVALRVICQNAIEALQHGGCIEVGLECGDGDVRIAIRDDGPGIRPEERRHLFDPYYSARQAGRGLGLGLSKAWRIITNHGGRIEVESRPGQGAAFSIVLPELAAPT
jgi:signal transduction histidine kinase